MPELTPLSYVLFYWPLVSLAGLSVPLAVLVAALISGAPPRPDPRLTFPRK